MKILGAKGGFFFSESVIRFSNLQISKKKIFQKTILNLKFKFPAYITLLLLARKLDFKPRIVFWNMFFGRFGDLKNESHFLKKATFRYLRSNLTMSCLPFSKVLIPISCNADISRFSIFKTSVSSSVMWVDIYKSEI